MGLDELLVLKPPTLLELLPILVQYRARPSMHMQRQASRQKLKPFGTLHSATVLRRASEEFFEKF